MRKSKFNLDATADPALAQKALDMVHCILNKELDPKQKTIQAFNIDA